MSNITSLKKRQEDAVKKQNGQIAPDVDQDGKMINPHNPDFITKVPWYLGNSGPTLKHHNIQKNDQFLTMTETDELIKSKLSAQARLLEAGKSNTFRKGACKNCGSMTHKEKDCVERPRSSKKAAWKSGLDIAPDEVTLKLEDHGKVSYSAKRDMWQGYDSTQYESVVERFNRLEAERKKFKQQQREQRKIEDEQKKKLKKEEKEKKKQLDKSSSSLSAGKAPAAGVDGKKSDPAGTDVDNDDDDADGESVASDSDSDSGSEYDSDEEDEEEEEDAREFVEKDENARDFQARLARQGGVGGAQMKVTARNLRIREDTPKYLRNLSLDSAFYDPKSRSMRMNPFPDENPEDLPFAGDNFVRYSGDALKLAQTQVLCWEMEQQQQKQQQQGGGSGVGEGAAGVDVISNPSLAELMHRKVSHQRKEQSEKQRKEVLEKYGVQPTAPLDPRLRLGQTEAYSEYSWDGRVIRGAGKAIPRSKYEEDVFINNHTAIWGSYYNRLRQCWGFACCHAILKNAYCTGEAGRQAHDVANNQTLDPNQARQMLENRAQLSKKASASAITKRSDIYGESSGAEVDEEALREALKRAEEQRKTDASAGESDDRRRSYNSMKSVDVSVEDMEAYRLKKQRRDDPMAALLDSDELLEK